MSSVFLGYPVDGCALNVAWLIGQEWEKNDVVFDSKYFFIREFAQNPSSAILTNTFMPIIIYYILSISVCSC